MWQWHQPPLRATASTLGWAKYMMAKLRHSTYSDNFYFYLAQHTRIISAQTISTSPIQMFFYNVGQFMCWTFCSMFRNFFKPFCDCLIGKSRGSRVFVGMWHFVVAYTCNKIHQWFRIHKDILKIWLKKLLAVIPFENVTIQSYR